MTKEVGTTASPHPGRRIHCGFPHTIFYFLHYCISFVYYMDARYGWLVQNCSIHFIQRCRTSRRELDVDCIWTTCCRAAQSLTRCWIFILHWLRLNLSIRIHMHPSVIITQAQAQNPVRADIYTHIYISTTPYHGTKLHSFSFHLSHTSFYSTRLGSALLSLIILAAVDHHYISTLVFLPEATTPRFFIALTRASFPPPTPRHQ